MSTRAKTAVKKQTKNDRSPPGKAVMNSLFRLCRGTKLPENNQRQEKPTQIDHIQISSEYVKQTTGRPYVLPSPLNAMRESRRFL